MYKSENKGLRCQICTGCGRCPGIKNQQTVSGRTMACDSSTSCGSSSDTRRLHVLTGSAIETEMISITNREHKRLVAVDIGTTTIAMVLYGEDGSEEDCFYKVNPQTAFGADVISRIQAAENRIFAEQQKDMVRKVLGEGFEQFQKKISKEEKLFAVIAANTTMNYLLMGWNTAELGTAPFLATHLDTVHTDIAGTECVILPGLSAFVGSDIVAGIEACGMAEQEQLTLLVDLGTNGEMVLGNRQKMTACATAAGPAFEGGVNRGVWGADMVSLLARLLREKIVDETGLLCEPYFETGIRIGDVCVTQESIRAIQLAKSAIATGIDILAERHGVNLQKIERVVLAGGFGYYLNPEAAAEIGLLPDVLRNRSAAGGNTALAGAKAIGARMLSEFADVDFPSVWRKRGTKLEILNLAQEKMFAEKYLSYMNLAKI